MRHPSTTSTIGTALLIALLGGCGEIAGAADDDVGDYPGGGMGGDAGAPSEGEDPEGEDPEGEDPVVEPGQLTAGEWDDNVYYDFFLTSLDEFFSGDRQIASLDVTGRVVISVSDAVGQPISNAVVEVFDDSGTYLSAPTGTDGRLLYFPGIDGAPTEGAVQVRISPLSGSPEVMSAPSGAHWDLEVSDAAAAPPSALDLLFVIDATGSMGDELEYVKAEVSAIAAAIRSEAGDISIRYGLIVYRDNGDDYVVRSFDFTESLDDMRADLENQSANGGGDYPEAMDRALAAMSELQWRTDSNTARVAFLIADAPPHDEAAQQFLESANGARLSGIKIYPVAASGVEQRAEYLMRTAALVSLGRYLFLTDDSGIGNSHAEPHIPCYRVELLNGLMVRTALSELAGAYLPPGEEDIIRVVGQFDESGLCVLHQE